MTDTKTHSTLEKIAFSSTVFPSAEDMALWNRLSDAEKRAVIARDEDAGVRSGVAPKESVEERLSRVRAHRAL